MTNKICINCVVSGKVQNVWFRATTQKEAQKLNLTGWVRNLPDGRVEVLACGPEEGIAQLKSWLRHGPPRAEVTDLQCTELPWQSFERFEIT